VAGFVLAGCLAPRTVDGVRWNDLSRCPPGATACTVRQWGTLEIFCSDLDPLACEHELVFHRRHGGTHREPWRRAGGIPYTIVIDPGTDPAWRAGDCMMRSDRGPIVRCSADVLRLAQ
jgi:hypothetical protein